MWLAEDPHFLFRSLTWLDMPNKPPTAVAAAFMALVLGLATAVTGTPEASAAATGASVPVVSCPSSYGGSPLTGPVQPSTEKTGLPASTASRLALYTDKERTLPPVLGPRRWSCQVMVGADGTVGVNIYPPGTRPQPSGTGHSGIHVLSDSACQGCVYDTVCSFDPGAAKALGYSGLPCSPLAKGEVVTWKKGSPKNNKPPVHDIIDFVVPGHEATNGVVLFDLTKSGGMASEDDCTLPPTGPALCKAVLGSFTQENWLMP